jgi:Ca2+-binding RTX toxin-like protein
MPNIIGSNGNDTLVGTAYVDRLVPLLGFDWVDGGASRDLLVVNYGAIAGASYSYSSVGSSGGSFGGFIQSGDGQNAVSFQNVERLDLTLDSGDSTFSLEGSALALEATIDVDAGAGFDLLEANFSALDGISFEVEPNGKVKLDGSSFSNFESYFLTLGAGADKVTLGEGNDVVISGGGDDRVDVGGGNDLVIAGAGNDSVIGGSGDDTLYGEGGTNILSGGDGDDQLVSQGSDTVDGGDGYDYWQGDYQISTENLAFTYNGSSGSVSNGTMLTSIENLAFFGGAGDDVVTISGSGRTPEGGSSVVMWSGAGYDTLSVDLSNGAIGRDFIAVSAEGTSFSGSAGGVSFSDFEQASFTGDNGDTASLALFVDSGLEVVVQADGTLTTNVGITLFNYDIFSVTLGEGNDTMVSGAGRDTISGEGGDDIIAGGEGGDNLFGGAGADTFVYNSIADTGFGSGRTDGILDFSSEEGDRIDLQNVIEEEFSFIGGGEFSGTGMAELRTVDAGGGFYFVQGDVDGDGVMDFRFVVLPTQELTASDFLL